MSFLETETLSEALFWSTGTDQHATYQPHIFISIFYNTKKVVKLFFFIYIRLYTTKIDNFGLFLSSFETFLSNYVATW